MTIKKNFVLLFLLLLLQTLNPSWATSNSPEQPLLTQCSIQDKTCLENWKIVQETRKLEIENNLIISLAPFLTAIASVLGVLLTFVLTFNKQKSEDNRLRNEQFEQIKREERLNFEQKINSFFKNMGADSESLQIGAAFSLLNFLQEHNKKYLYFDTIFNVLINNLKRKPKPLVKDILTRVLERIMQLQMNQKTGNSQPSEIQILNFSRTKLTRPNFENLNFEGIQMDMAFSDLTLANLRYANLYRLRGFKVILNKARLSYANLQEARLNNANCQSAQFHDCVLISATFKNAHLEKAQFMRAKLQSAHFEEADIRGAKFEGADLNDAYFYGANFDDTVKFSLINAKNWRKAHFNTPIKEELEKLDLARRKKVSS